MAPPINATGTQLGKMEEGVRPFHSSHFGAHHRPLKKNPITVFSAWEPKT